MEDFKQDHHLDIGYAKIKERPKYKELKGFKHIWTYFTTDRGNFICSQYSKEKGVYMTTITNTPKGWKIHLFYGGSKWHGYFKVISLLAEAVGYCELFLQDKLVINEKWYS